jgi:hypothetical protein
MSVIWEDRYPLCNAWSLTRVGSDHSHIILDSGEHGAPRPKYFFFENKWTLRPDFNSLVTEKWEQSAARRPEGCKAMDAWHAWEPVFPTPIPERVEHQARWGPGQGKI